MNEWYGDWQQRRGDVSASLADTLEQAIRSGRLPAGSRLPTHRDLSKQLGVAVSTVTRAYAEATRRGLVDATVGRGTFVLKQGNTADGAAPRDELKPLDRLYLPLMQREDAINLSLNEPLTAGTDERLRKAIAALTAKDNLNALAHYQPAQGQIAHRQAGAAWLKELGVEASAEDVYTVSGGQTALMTIFLGLARSGDTVLTEELTWPGALSVGRLTGIRLKPVAIDDEGMVPAAFEQACISWRPRFVYTMPTLHNPTTATASLKRRQEIARIARAHNVLIVEDDAYGFLIEPRATPYFELARDITVYLTSLSKSIAPALRVGFMAVPPRLHKAMRAAMRATTTMVSPILLELTTHMINSGAGREAIKVQRNAAAKRQTLAASILGPEGSAATSMHYWLRLPSDIRNSVFVADALSNGVAVTPGDAFVVAPGHDPGGVRICLCAEPDPGRVEAALRTLARLIQTDHAAALAIV
ncbi:MAG TPA: PLP-dependent aminotransferase family protein [Candidatus Binatia bacterium]|nr:PLP-dependent aminotransferase family protein [Candidatus Binatia bacterium]